MLPLMVAVTLQRLWQQCFSFVAAVLLHYVAVHVVPSCVPGGV